MAEIGLLTGLAQNLGYDQRVNDLRWNEQQSQRALAESEAKAKMFADDLEFQNSANEHDAPIIKEYAKNKINEIGRYVRENPDWVYNVDKRNQLNLMKRELKDNTELRRGLASDDNFKALNLALQEVAKNPNSHDVGAYEDLLKQKQNYLQYGNQDGLEAFQKEGKKAFVFNKPQDFIDKNKLFKDVGGAMQARGIEYLKNGRNGGYRTFATDEDLKNEANAIYASHKRQFDQEYTTKGLNPIEEISKSLLPYVKYKLEIGEKNTLGEQMALAKYKHGLDNAISTGASPYKITVLNADYAKVPADLLGQTFGSRIPHTLPAGKDGNPIDNTGDVFNYDGDIHDKNYIKGRKYEKNGVKTVHGYVYKSLEFGEEVGYLKNPLFGEIEVLPGYKDKVSIVDMPMDKDGNTRKVLRIKTTADVNANDPSYQGRYDKEISTTKQREGFGINESMMNAGTYNGLPIGNIVERAGEKYLVTENGLVPQ